jgi:hypothetical protein
VPVRKVFGVGFSKTGTTSLERALERLGYNVCRGWWRTNHSFYLMALYVNGDTEEILRMTAYWDAFADGPWGGTDLYLALYDRYPDARFLLTVRDADAWYRSFESMITEFDTDLDTAMEAYHAKYFGSAYFFRHLFGIEKLAGNREKILGQYRAHNEAARRFFAEKGAAFLELDVTAGDGWEKLCGFLECEVPAEPFPHGNPSAKRGGAGAKRGRARGGRLRRLLDG